jgi:hypothetical protein
VKRRLAWELVSWKGAAIPKELEPGSRGIVTVRSRYQATTSEDTAGWKRLGVCSSNLKNVEISDGTIIKCRPNYELCAKVVNKSNTQPKTPPRVTHTT